MHNYYVYILSSPKGVLYTGMTNNLVRRLREHREKRGPGFAAEYEVTRLLWFEHTTLVHAAIARERQIKGWTRRRKVALVRTMNPEFADLAANIGAVDDEHAEKQRPPRDRAR